VSIDPHEPIRYIPAELAEFFVRHGYTVVQPTRRGIGESIGTFVEECAFAAGKCSLVEYRALAEPGTVEAVRDTNAVIDQVVDGVEVPKGSKILFVGISRGGYLAANDRHTRLADQAIKALHEAGISNHRFGAGSHSLDALLGNWTDGQILIYIHSAVDHVEPLRF